MMEKEKQKKKISVNLVISIIFAILIIIELIIWTITFVKDNSTLNICGYKPYIVEYDDNIYGLKKGDLAIAKELKNKDDYMYNEAIIYKAKYQNDKTALILRESDYSKIKNNSISRFEGKLKSSKRGLGSLISFFRETYVVLISIIIALLICIIIYFVRLNKKEELSKEYIRDRRIKDISVITFIIVTYISIFFIGRLYENSGIIITDRKEMVENTIENNVTNVTNVTNNNIDYNEITNTSNNLSNNKSNGNINDDGIEFDVTENDRSWKQLQYLKIFNNNYFNGQNKIAPGLSGSYNFKVKNMSSKRMKYVINFYESNDYNINLKYKLKKNGEYIVSDYVSANNLSSSKQSLGISESDIYTIEWKWVDSDNDTEIGENAENVKYNLAIKVDGEAE